MGAKGTLWPLKPLGLRPQISALAPLRRISGYTRLRTWVYYISSLDPFPRATLLILRRTFFKSLRLSKTKP